MRGIALFATLARQDASLPERHLGLVPASELEDVDALLDALADQLALDDAAWNTLRSTAIETSSEAAPPALLKGRTVAVARDAAFAFLYPANLDTLRAMGASLTFFSPLADEPVPPEADALYLPGGYPELHAQALSTAGHWLASVRAAHASGLPILAECGGMMALAGTLTDQAGQTWPMAGLIRGAIVMQKRLAGLGSQALETPHGQLRGHTFHYSTLETDEQPVTRTVKHPGGAAGEAFYRCGSLSASYFHAWFASRPEAVAALLSRGQS
jgi:cobyrinic acid a,c-diamide synthase